MHPNAINTYGEHIVNPIMIGTNEPKYGSSDLDTYARKYTFDYAHKAENFAPYFNSKTGKPIATVNYGVKWYNWGEGYIHFQTNYVANKFIVTGNNREAVAKDYGIPIDRVVANDASIQTIGNFPQTFTILPKFSSNKDKDKSDSSKQDNSQTKSSYSNLEFANLLNTIYMQEEQQRLYQQYITNPGRLPLNSGVDSESTSSAPTSSPSKGPIGSTPSKNMPSSPISSSPSSTASSSSPFASTPISSTPTLGKNTPGNSAGSSGHGAAGGFGNSPSINTGSNPTFSPKSSPTRNSKNMPSFAPINANAGSGSGSVPGLTAGSEPFKGPTSSAPSPTPIKGPSG
ncbi:hypothetical protein SZ25_00305, partial [Candidatus Arcanobacter lacustris]